jgi:hypothetical protein
MFSDKDTDEANRKFEAMVDKGQGALKSFLSAMIELPASRKVDLPTDTALQYAHDTLNEYERKCESDPVLQVLVLQVRSALSNLTEVLRHYNGGHGEDCLHGIETLAREFLDFESKEVGGEPTFSEALNKAIFTTDFASENCKIMRDLISARSHYMHLAFTFHLRGEVPETFHRAGNSLKELLKDIAAAPSKLMAESSSVEGEKISKNLFQN